jgi:hypothetical protein
VGGGTNLNHDLSLMSELDAVANEVDQNLPQSGYVPDQDLGEAVIDRVSKVQPLLSGFGSKQFQGGFHAALQLKGVAVQLDLAGFDYLEIEDIVDDSQ